jgi:hypothetical protein
MCGPISDVPVAVPLPFFRNLEADPASCHTAVTMSQTPESSIPVPSPRGPTSVLSRPFRVKFRGSVLMLIQLPNHRQLRGNLHQLSITGGLMHLEKPLDEKLEVEVIFHLRGITIREKAVILFPMWATQGWLQPFRFVELRERCKSELHASLLSFAPKQESKLPRVADQPAS